MAPRKPKPVGAIVALVSLVLLIGGMAISYSPAVSATPMGALIDATRHVRDSEQEAPMILYWAGIVVAAAFIGRYFWGMREYDPYKGKRHPPD